MYDNTVSDDDGLLWKELVDWWCEQKGQSQLPREKSEANLLSRLKASMNEPERVVFKTYFATFAGELATHLPALIPQVYLHYDPYTIKQLAGKKNLPRQRMDFLLLLPHKKRVVLEIDGEQHYSVNKIASPKLYAEMVEEDRRLRLSGYEVFRFGGYEFIDSTIGERLEDFFRRLFDLYTTT